jgi:hypothetical protein
LTSEQSMLRANEYFETLGNPASSPVALFVKDFLSSTTRKVIEGLCARTQNAATISQSQLCEFLSEYIGASAANQHASQMFSEMDVNHDRFVTADEISRWYQAYNRSILNEQDSELQANIKRRSHESVPQISRALSLALPEASEEVRKISAQSFLEHKLSPTAFVLPDISGFSDAFRGYIKRDLFQLDHLSDLSPGGAFTPHVINWDPQLSHLTPLKTSGDGNCLLHAASLGLWGVHDRDLAMRKALKQAIQGPLMTRFQARWRLSKQFCGETQLEADWRGLTRQTSVSPEVSAHGKAQFNFLEQLHVMVLAHVLRRPIVVYADPHIRDFDGKVCVSLDDDSRMDGVYLPLELDPAECLRAPLALSFHGAHFAPLVSEENKKQHHVLPSPSNRTKATTPAAAVTTPTDTNTPCIAKEREVHEDEEEEAAIALSLGCAKLKASSSHEEKHEISLAQGEDRLFEALLPLVDSSRKPLVVHFTMEAEKQDLPTLMERYLDSTHTPNGIWVARQRVEGRPEFVSAMLHRYLEQAHVRVDAMPAKELNALRNRIARVPCVGDCGFFGLPENDDLCSQCYKNRHGQKDSHALHNNSNKNNDYNIDNGRALNSKITDPNAPPPGWSGGCVGGCGFYGQAKQAGYCSKCFKSRSQPSTLVGARAPLCAFSCGKTAKAEFDGLCDVCFCLVNNLPAGAPAASPVTRTTTVAPLPTSSIPMHGSNPGITRSGNTQSQVRDHLSNTQDQRLALEMLHGLSTKNHA